MTTYYVDGAVGSDANAGTSEGAGNAWATIDKAMNTVVGSAGDHVYVKASATYNELVTIDNAGGTGIAFEGYTSTPGDGGKATISGTTNCITSSLGAHSYCFLNFIFTGASSHGVSLGAGAGDNVCFVNCEFTGNGGHGLYADNYIFVHQCIFANNTSNGFQLGTVVGAHACKAYGNGERQMYCDGGMAYCIGNLVYGHTNTSYDAVESAGTSNAGVILNNTVDGEGNAVSCLSTGNSFPLVANNIFYDGASYGFESSYNTNYWANFIRHNLANSNGIENYYNSARTAAFGSSDPAFGANVTGAPGFTDEANDDYTLGDASPAKDAGLGVD
jgi:hypothetical protein